MPGSSSWSATGPEEGGWHFSAPTGSAGWCSGRGPVACREAVRRRSPEPPGFGWTTETDCRCDLVANVFVLSVLPDPGQRIKALQRAARFVRPGGHLFVVTRSPGDIEPRGAGPLDEREGHVPSSIRTLATVASMSSHMR